MGQVKLRVKQGKDGQWYPFVQSANGQILLSGEGHPRERDGVRSLANACAGIAEAVMGFPPKSIGRAVVKTVGANGRVVK